jgi:hypothetical protein
MAFTGDKAPDTPEASSSSSHVSASLTGGDYPRPKLLTAQSAPRSDASSTSSDPQPTSHRSATPPTSAYSTPDAPDSSKSPLDNYDLAVLEFVPSSSPRITGTATPESASASAPAWNRDGSTVEPTEDPTPGIAPGQSGHSSPSVLAAAGHQRTSFRLTIHSSYRLLFIVPLRTPQPLSIGVHTPIALLSIHLILWGLVNCWAQVQLSRAD